MLRESVRIEVLVPIDDRVRYLNDRYDHWQSSPEALLEKLKWLNQRHGQAEVDAWSTLAKAGDWHAFVKRLLQSHYDPAYQSALAKASGTGREIATDALLDDGCERAAAQLLEMKF